MELPAQKNLAIGPLTKEETKTYLDQLWPANTRSADELYKETAGVPGRLNALRLEQKNDLSSIAEMISTSQ